MITRNAKNTHGLSLHSPVSGGTEIPVFLLTNSDLIWGALKLTAQSSSLDDHQLAPAQSSQKEESLSAAHPSTCQPFKHS